MVLLSNHYFFYRSIIWILSSITPVPSATHVSGLSAVNTGTFNSWARIWLKPSTSDPPPVKTIPLSIMSADNSGGVCSKIPFAAWIIV